MKKTTKLSDIFQPTPFMGSPLPVSLRDLRRALDNDQTDLSPAYQRGSVWSAEQQAAFVGHLLSGGEVLPIIVQRLPESGRAEVLDGKQRIEACLSWLAGDVPARLPDGREIFVGDLDLDARGRPAGLSRVDLTFRYVNLPWAERCRFYARLNSAGTPHTKEQIAAALALAGQNWMADR